MHPLFTIEIPKRAHACYKGGEPFLPGWECHSCLIFNEAESTYERQDFCAACWNTQPHPPCISSWKTKIPPHKQDAPKGKESTEQALSLLKASLESEASTAPYEAFILSLYLARRRILAARKELLSTSGIVYEVLETGEMLCVPEVKLSEIQIPEMERQLAGKFR